MAALPRRGTLRPHPWLGRVVWTSDLSQATMMTDHSLTVGLFVMVTFFATMVQTLAGFAFALIMMPIVTMILGVRTAAPLVALTALTLYGVNSIRYHASPNLGGDLAAGGNIRGRGFTRHLGGCECQRSFRQSADRLDSFSYGLYGLTRPSSLQPCSPRWAYLAGFLSGSLVARIIPWARHWPCMERCASGPRTSFARDCSRCSSSVAR